MIHQIFLSLFALATHNVAYAMTFVNEIDPHLMTGDYYDVLSNDPSEAVFYCNFDRFDGRSSTKLYMTDYSNYKAVNGSEIKIKCSHALDYTKTITGDMTFHCQENMFNVSEMTVWFVDLGPLDSDGKYSYYIEYTAGWDSLYVSARNITEFNLLYRTSVLNKLQSLAPGQTFVDSYQGSDCVYPPLDPLMFVDVIDPHRLTGHMYEAMTDDPTEATFCDHDYFDIRNYHYLSWYDNFNMGSPTGPEVELRCYYELDYSKPITGDLVFKCAENMYNILVFEVWIVDLGPVDTDGKYSYVSFYAPNPMFDHIYVTARNLTEFNLRYRTDVVTKVQTLSPGRTLLDTYQGADCVYDTPVDESLVLVSDLDVDKYVGRWFEMYTDDYVYSRWEKEYYCATKTYTHRSYWSSTLLVHNHETIHGPTGESRTLDGYMDQLPSTPGSFELHFPQVSELAMHYWVLDLGPLNDEGLYSYVITTDPTGKTMWVLARDVEEFKLKYDWEVHKKLEALGFKNGAKMPVPIYQGSDCAYETSLDLEPVKEMISSQYAGLWYEMYTDEYVSSRWEKDEYCNTHTYSLRDTSAVMQAHYYISMYGPDGTQPKTLDGYMWYDREGMASAGEWNLNFPTITNVTMHSWILALGPLNDEGLYSYAITSDPTGNTMWVLARDVEEFNLRYDGEVQKILLDLGFNSGGRKPKAMYQGSDCVYEHQPEIETVRDLVNDKYAGFYYTVYTDYHVSQYHHEQVYCETIHHETTGNPSTPLTYVTHFMLHAQNTSLANGEAVHRHGYMHLTNASEPGKFEMVETDLTHHHRVPYWVYDLGPLGADGHYAYSITGSKNGNSMWVNARDIDEFFEKYDAEVIAKLKGYGYTSTPGDMQIVKVYQGTDCDYTQLTYAELNPPGMGSNNDPGIIVGVIVVMLVVGALVYVILNSDKFSGASSAASSSPKPKPGAYASASVDDDNL